MPTEMLPCVLTADEAASRAQELATLVRKIEEEESAAKAAAAAARDSLKEMDSDLRRLARVVREGREDRQVEVRASRNLTTGTFEVVRLDTGVVIRTRPLTPEELQIPLHLVSDEDAGEVYR